MVSVGSVEQRHLVTSEDFGFVLQVELEQMKMKSEKLERERNELKQHCDKLETRVRTSCRKR